MTPGARFNFVPLRVGAEGGGRTKVSPRERGTGDLATGGMDAFCGQGRFSPALNLIDWFGCRHVNPPATSSHAVPGAW